jgi:glycosyltransferase involved in cell wall biosynthesis
VLLVIPGLRYSGAARQLTLLAMGLQRERFEPRVCVLGRSGPWAESLQAAGVPVEILAWTRVIDLRALWRLRRLLHGFRPDVIHAWGPAALGAVFQAGGRNGARLLVSDPTSPRQRGTAAWPGDRAATLSRVDGWLLRRADGVVAAGPAEAERFRRLGLAAERIAVIPPGVTTEEVGPACRRYPELPETAHRIVAAGPIEPHKGFRDALWTMGMLRFLSLDIHLLLIGEGSDRLRLERFARATGVADRVHLLGCRDHVAPLLQESHLAWIPSRGDGGRSFALEAMVASRPIIASRLPGLAEIVVDGETGFLIHPGDRVALARRSRELLADAELRRRLGEAGRRRVMEHFPAAALVRRFASLYETGSVRQAG